MTMKDLNTDARTTFDCASAGGNVRGWSETVFERFAGRALTPAMLRAEAREAGAREAGARGGARGEAISRKPLIDALSGAGWRGGLLGLATVLSLAFGAPDARAGTDLLNVSYDPTREFYRAYDELFAKWWTDQGHDPVRIEQSHGGSGGQARAVIDGLEATVVTLALSADIDAIAEKSGKIPADWQSRLPHNASPYTSTIVFLVRAGNPKGIKDWDDLVRKDVKVITPNPKTSGGARWNFMAAWAYGLQAGGGDEGKARDYVGALLRNVPVLDTGARGATTTFAQRGIGDVLLAWENEAFLAQQEQGAGKFEIIVPSVTMLAEPPVAMVDGNIKTDAQRELAQAYLEHLYSPQAQALALKNFYRAWDVSLADKADIDRFPDVKRIPIADFGGWDKVQPEFFGDGGIFDQIYGE